MNISLLRAVSRQERKWVRGTTHVGVGSSWPVLQPVALESECSQVLQAAAAGGLVRAGIPVGQGQAPDPMATNLRWQGLVTCSLPDLQAPD